MGHQGDPGQQGDQQEALVPSEVERFQIEHNSWEPWDYIHAPDLVHCKHPGAARCIRVADFQSIHFQPITVSGCHFSEGGGGGGCQRTPSITSVQTIIIHFGPICTQSGLIRAHSRLWTHPPATTSGTCPQWTPVDSSGLQWTPVDSQPNLSGAVHWSQAHIWKYCGSFPKKEIYRATS